MKSNITLGCLSIARLVKQSPGNLSIRGRIERWEGVDGMRWAVPASVVSERFNIPLSEVEAHAKAEADARARKKNETKLRRIARVKSKGGA